MRPGFGGLPKGAERWGEARWNRHHSEAADAIGCRYEPARVKNGPLLIAAAVSHTEGPMAGRPFAFLPWFEHRIVHPFYGYIDCETGLRRYRKCYLFVAKKNAKTTSMGPLLLTHLVNDGEVGARVYSAAGSVEQASEVYNVAMPMVVDSPALSTRLLVRDANRRIVFPATHSWYQVLSAEVSTKHGQKPSCTHFDELHAQPNRHLWDVLTIGASAARVAPALFATSTAGYDRNGVCYEEWEYARKVLRGSITDPQLLPVIYEMPDDADWKNEDSWALANPSMGTLNDLVAGRATLTVEDMRSEFRRALDVPANENAFRMLRLNQWVSQESRFIPMSTYDALAALPVMDFTGRDYFAGLDLSSTTDLTAYAELGLDDSLAPHVGAGTHFWLPGANIDDRERRDHVPYREWARQGWLTLTEGNIIDHRSIIAHIERRSAEVGFPREIAFDPYSARQLCEVELPAMGYETVPVRQGFISLSEPTKKLLEYIIGGTLHHGGNPVLRWMMDNAVASVDPAGNIKLDKSKATGRIDGCAALVNAISRASLYSSPPSSVYEERGLLTL